MPANRRLALHATLPDRYARLEVVASTVDHLGRLVALVADPAQGFVPIPHFSELRPPPRYDATVVICDGADIREIPLSDLDLWFTRIDTLGDGVVLASTRCAPPGVPRERYLEPVPRDELLLTANVQVIDGDGRTQAAFYAGDGIEQLMTDLHGNIWTSYFDESEYWAANPDGTCSNRFMLGLARWDKGGAPLWLASDTPGVVWCDCYALNVGRDLVHACPYTDFPLVEIDANGIRTVTPNPVTRCSGLAVCAAELAFLDQRRMDDEYYWEIRRARREGGIVVETGREPLVLPESRHPKSWARGKIGRDGMLWLHEDGDRRRWYRYEIDT
ncbi:hypothetical protein [Microtetraspora sp. NBRC 16547]|uniref:hypothetical protein n=1 Tax=Microtetraspora sp. NBRC 16547 TaxID=3030993 RepID=UPI0024A310D2|nr:hypothetical protein [Microtetraspora sp. NBRC 16547]GLX02186.1 hypothetical protein Misp02_62720 [Microtetraspora sp. NBRC 16547]